MPAYAMFTVAAYISLIAKYFHTTKRQLSEVLDNVSNVITPIFHHRLSSVHNLLRE